MLEALNSSALEQEEMESTPPSWPQAEATVMESFTQFRFSQGEQLDAVLQLRQHLQTLLEIQLAGGGLQAREFSLKLGELLGGVFEAERDGQVKGADKGLYKAKALLERHRKETQEQEERQVEEELLYWEEKGRLREERRSFGRGGWGSRQEGYMGGGDGGSWDIEDLLGDPAGAGEKVAWDGGYRAGEPMGLNGREQPGPSRVGVMGEKQQL